MNSILELSFIVNKMGIKTRYACRAYVFSFRIKLTVVNFWQDEMDQGYHLVRDQ